MKLPEKAELLRIFIGEDDRIGGHPLYRVIVEKAREQGQRNHLNSTIRHQRWRHFAEFMASPP